MKLHAKVIATMRQTAYNCAGLRPHDKCTTQHGAAQICNERRPPLHTTRAQRPSKDQVGPRRKPHAHTASTQVGAVAVIQGSQGGK